MKLDFTKKQIKRCLMMSFLEGADDAWALSELIMMIVDIDQTFLAVRNIGWSFKRVEAACLSNGRLAWYWQYHKDEVEALFQK